MVLVISPTAYLSCQVEMLQAQVLIRPINMEVGDDRHCVYAIQIMLSCYQHQARSAYVPGDKDNLCTAG